MSSSAPDRAVALVTLGCSRNEVDSEELAGRLADAGWRMDDSDPDVVVVNTCGFIEHAKQESIQTLLDASGGRAKVVAVGCMAERYGNELADHMPEADAVLSFDDYSTIDDKLAAVLRGETLTAHTPTDRRTLLPITPVARQQASVALPGHDIVQAPDLTKGPASGPRVMRRRLDDRPVAPLKLASGCDRRCTFCAIPTFRGAFVSRPPAEVLAEARWLAEQGVTELFLVSENSTSYGKDLGDSTMLEKLLPELATVDGIARVRVSYLQPAETRPGLLAAIAHTDGVASYYDLSFQHASASVLRRMRRFGGIESFVDLVDRVRALDPEAGIRSNFIVGFPGETEDEFAELLEFVSAARLDAIGIFEYSDEEGTAAADLPGKLDADEISARYEAASIVAEEVTSQRAADRVGTAVEVLVESVAEGEGGFEIAGRAHCHAPEVDGEVTAVGVGASPRVGQLVAVTVTDTDGVDLVGAVKS